MTRHLQFTLSQTKQVVAWANANRLNATRIPAEDALWLDGDQIHYRELVNVNGGDTGEVLAVDGHPVLTEWRTTPLLVPPSVFGLDTAEVDR